MNYLDIIIGILLLIAFIMGYRQGFIRQFFGLLALLLGVFCAYKFSHFAAHYIAQWTQASEAVVNAVAFAVTFIAVLVGVNFVGIFADKIITMVALGWLNKMLGIIMALAKEVLILGVIIVILDMFHIVPKAHVEKSFLYQPLENIGTTVFPYLKKLLTMTFGLF